MITFAKGVTNAAVPMAGVMASKRIYDAFMTGPEHMVELFHGYTYSGHPLAAAAGLATLDIYKDEGLFERAQEARAGVRRRHDEPEGRAQRRRHPHRRPAVRHRPRSRSPASRACAATRRPSACTTTSTSTCAWPWTRWSSAPPLIATETDIAEIRDRIAKVLKAVA